VSPRPRETTDAEILAATQRVVSRLGPSLTLGDVAKEAGVSPATLMQRFGSKRGLLLAFASSGSQNLGDEFARIRLKHRSAIAAVYDVALCVAAMADTPETLSNSLAFLQMDLIDPDFHKHALAHSRGMIAGIKALLDEGVEGGELQRCDTTRLARAVQALIGGSLLQWAIARRPTVCARIWIRCSSRATAPRANEGVTRGEQSSGFEIPHGTMFANGSAHGSCDRHVATRRALGSRRTQPA
jgi:AcrR family transcriptional regulator